MLLRERKAQTAVEYLLLLTTIATIVLIGFRIYLPRIQDTANIYYNRAAPGILGTPPLCGDGHCSTVEKLDGAGGKIRCPTDC